MRAPWWFYRLDARKPKTAATSALHGLSLSQWSFGLIPLALAEPQQGQKSNQGGG
jgi:hypothetical protein